ncbi:uncharacterized protein BDV17DRAFT_289137 [Aspergillus undulatus]|uniref:uncharacterized protein n=1 Tax=Aspergillus undulatus TaxID=1810928 RepID=UPI003CCDE1BB
MQQINSFFKSKDKTNTGPSTSNNTNANTTTTPQQSDPKPRHQSNDPVLTPEDEAFLRKVTAENPTAAPAPAPGQDGVARTSGIERETETGVGETQQQPLPDPAEIPIPMSPVEEFGKELGERERKRSVTAAELTGGADTNTSTAINTGAGAGRGNAGPSSAKGGRSASPAKKKKWSLFWKKGEGKTSEKNPEPIPAPGSKDPNEQKQENEDMTEILDKLNLAADNNRVFSISDETQELLRKFKLIFKDLINGVPTAYHDLEMLLTNGNRQLQDTYSSLPGPLQKLIEKLPERWTESLAPEMIAVAAERASKSGVNVDNIGKAAAAANKVGIQVPSLKELVGKPAAIVGMLRSIMAFLRASVLQYNTTITTYTNASTFLLFVLWYCHKRGREVRLENERLVTEEEIEKMNSESSGEAGTSTTDQIRSTETLTTTAAQGASAAEVREGIKDAQRARGRKALALTSADNTENTNQTQGQKNEEKIKENKPTGAENEPIKPTRSKSILSIFGRSGSAGSTPSRRNTTANARTNSSSDVKVYPGT